MTKKVDNPARIELKLITTEIRKAEIEMTYTTTMPKKEYYVLIQPELKPFGSPTVTIALKETKMIGKRTKEIMAIFSLKPYYCCSQKPVEVHTTCKVR